MQETVRRPAALAQAQIAAGLRLQHERKVLRAHARREIAHHVVLADQFGGHVTGESGLQRMVDRRRVDALVDDFASAPNARAVDSTNSVMRRSTSSCVSIFDVRTVPVSFASRGTTENAPGLPACIEHRLSTAFSSGATLRETIVCAAVMMCAATTTGSTVRCGCAPCPPLPQIVISTRSADDIIGPEFSPIWPAGNGGQLCIA